MRITNCTKKDLENIYLIDKEIYGIACYPKFVIIQFFDCFGENIKIAIDENKTIGFSINGMTNESKEGWILSLGVSLEYQRRGVGAKLLTESIKEFRNKGIRIIKLTVHPENPAYKLYKENGFEDIKRYDDYYGDNEKRILMALYL